MASVKRKQPARLSDIGPEANTRPDTVPAALRFADDSMPSSVFEPRPRELAPYSAVPELSARFDEPTVPDPALQRVSPVPPRVSEDHPAPDRTVVPRSGTRHRLVSTVPPPRVQRERERVRSDAALRDEQPPAEERRTTLASPSSERSLNRHQAFLLALLTVFASAWFGASLGSGSLGRLFERSRDEVPAPPVAAPVVAAPVVTAPPVVTPPVASPPVTTPPVTTPPVASPPLAAPAATAAPMRFEDLPIDQQARESNDERGKPARRHTRRR